MLKKPLNSLQFELWQECNSLCKYCYLGTDNRNTPTPVKIESLKRVLEKISDLSLYQGEHPVEVLSYLGGEFFQGQLNSPEVRELFFTLMKKTAWLLENNYIKQVWIYATMTIGDQKDLYDTLKLFSIKKDNFWLLTSYDTIGRFHNQKMKENWEYHMGNIKKLYPLIEFNTTTIITQDLIDKYLDNEFNFHQLSEKYHTQFFFKQPGKGNYTKEEMNAKLNNMFFPKRNDMIQFLSKFYMQEGEEMYDKLWNINYRADDLYRNFNKGKHMRLFHRNKGQKNEEILYDGQEMESLKCGHPVSYDAYSDSNACVLCDKLKIKKRMGK